MAANACFLPLSEPRLDVKGKRRAHKRKWLRWGLVGFFSWLAGGDGEADDTGGFI